MKNSQDFQHLLKAGLLNLLIGFAVVLMLTLGIGAVYTFFIGVIHLIRILLF